MNANQTQTIRSKAIEEASRRKLDMPNHYAFVSGANAYSDPDFRPCVSPNYRADFNAGFDWAKSLEDI